MVKKKKKTIKKASKKKIIKKRIAKKTPARKKPAAKKIAKKIAKIAPQPKPKATAGIPKKSIIGTITHYFPHVRAAVVKLKTPLAVGETVKIKGHTTDLQEIITSMQIDRVPVNSAKKGDEIGLLVESRVRSGDIVYRP